MNVVRHVDGGKEVVESVISFFDMVQDNPLFCRNGHGSVRDECDEVD